MVYSLPRISAVKPLYDEQRVGNEGCVMKYRRYSFRDVMEKNREIIHLLTGKKMDLGFTIEVQQKEEVTHVKRTPKMVFADN